MNEPSFLTVEDILFFHEQEILKAGGDPGIRQELEDKLEMKVDLVEYDAIKPALRDEIQREKELIPSL